MKSLNNNFLSLRYTMYNCKRGSSSDIVHVICNKIYTFIKYINIQSIINYLKVT